MECALDRAKQVGTQAPPLPISTIFFHAIHPNDITVPHAIHPNETVGAVPACPPERLRSGVSIPKIHALCAGDERRMRPCRATRAGTQAPPLPNSTIFFHAAHTNKITICAQSTQTKSTIYTQSHPNETRKQSPPHNNRGRKCIAHSRPLNSK